MAVVSAVDVLQADRAPLLRRRRTPAADVPLWERGALTGLLNAFAALGVARLSTLPSRAWMRAVAAGIIVRQRVAAHPIWNFSNPDLRVYRLDAPK